jgi:hypothetical protein
VDVLLFTLEPVAGASPEDALLEVLLSFESSTHPALIVHDTKRARQRVTDIEKFHLMGQRSLFDR